MLKRVRLLAGISLFWLGLSMLSDGINALVLPWQLSSLIDKNAHATALGLFTFAGLLAGALVQPFAGMLSDRLRPLFGRSCFIGLGVVLSFASMAVFAIQKNLASMKGAWGRPQQGVIGDLLKKTQRGDSFVTSFDAYHWRPLREGGTCVLM